jgi:hypothetical protein
MMTNLITQQSLESTNTLTYQILPETTGNSLLEPYNPLATIPICRILPNETTLTPRNTGTDDTRLNTNRADKKQSVQSKYLPEWTDALFEQMQVRWAREGRRARHVAVADPERLDLQAAASINQLH